MCIENATFLFHVKKNCVVFGKQKKLYIIGNVMSLAKMLLSHHFNKMRLLVFYELKLFRIFLYMDVGNAFSLQVPYKSWSETAVLGLTMFLYKK